MNPIPRTFHAPLKGAAKWLLPICLLLLFAAGAQAQTVTGTYAGILVYSASSAKVSITGFTSSLSGSVNIPATINVSGSNLPVTSIGEDAFDSCSSLTGVGIPNSVTSIGMTAFVTCTGLTTVTIPSSVTSIGNAAFLECSNLTTITVDNANAVYCSVGGVLFDKAQKTLIECPEALTGNYTIPNSVTSIGMNAFQDCSFTTISIPSSVNSIGTSAFQYSKNLSSITVDGSNAVYSSVSGVLFDKAQKTLIHFPDARTGSYAIPGSVTTVGDYSFQGCSLTSVTISSSVTTINQFAFSDCTGLSSVKIPGSVTNIGIMAFLSCSNLVSATFLGNAPTMHPMVFDDAASGFIIYYYSTATGFTTPTWNGYPTSVISSGLTITTSSPLISGTVGLAYSQTLTGTGGVTPYTWSITSGTLPAGLTLSNTGVISGTPTATYSGTVGIKVTGSDGGFATKNFGISVLSTGTTANGLIWSASSNQIAILGFTGTGSSLFIPSNINISGSNLPVTSIGSSAFLGFSSLTNVTIPSSVTSIGDSAFQNCSNLKSATFLGNAPAMGTSVFSSVASGFTVYYYSNATGFTTPTWNGYPTSIRTALGITTASPLITGYMGVTYGQTLTGTGGAIPYTWSLVSGTLPTGLTLNSTGVISGTPTVIFSGTVSIMLTGSDGVFATKNFGISIATTSTDANGLMWSASNNQVAIVGYTGTATILNVPNTINVSGSNLPVTSIGNYAFSGCTGLTSVTIPSSLTSVGSYAFYGCSKLTSVTIPSGVTSIGDSAFQNCGKLKSTTFFGNAPTMGGSVFASAASGFIIYYYSGATGFTTPTWNGYSTSIRNPLSITTGSPLLSGTVGAAYSQLLTGTGSVKPYTWSITSGTLPVGLALSSTGVISGTPSAAYSGTVGIMVTGSDGAFATNNFNILVVITGTTANGLIWLAAANQVTIKDYTGVATNINIPSNINVSGCNLPVTSIGDGAFIYNSIVTSVTIPSSVTNIGPYAFQCCGALNSVTICGNVANIGTNAFYWCGNLKSAVFLGNAPTIGNYVFFNPPSGFTIYYSSNSTGFTNPWKGNPTVCIGAPSPVKPWLISKGFAYNADLSSVPNKDGVPLLMSYALNLDPTQNQSRNLPKPYVSGSNLCLTYYASNLDVTYNVQTSADLQNWTTAGVSLSGPDTNGCYTASIPMTDPRRFMRLVVTHQ